MNIKCENNDIILTNVRDFKLKDIFECGQCFRFNAVGESGYFGVAFGRGLFIEQEGDTVVLHDTSEAEFKEIWYNFFDLGTDYGKIKAELAENDEIMQTAIKCGEGIRILKQDPWEMIISFIISQTNNIPRIKGIIERLCANFGESIEYRGEKYYSFPSAERIAALSIEDLGVIRAGFRDKYIMAAAKAAAAGEMQTDALMEMSAKDAKKTLMGIKGIGNKVSDCILLFGLNKTDAFPVDVWIKRIMEYCYFDGEQTIPTISKFAAEKFGELGGYAQQYLFFYARENKIAV